MRRGEALPLSWIMKRESEGGGLASSVFRRVVWMMDGRERGRVGGGTVGIWAGFIFGVGGVCVCACACVFPKGGGGRA